MSVFLYRVCFSYMHEHTNIPTPNAVIFLSQTSNDWAAEVLFFFFSPLLFLVSSFFSFSPSLIALPLSFS